MAKASILLNRFNRGMVSPLALARTELESMPFFAEIQTNWMPRVMGSMSLRPGLGYIGTTYTSAVAYHIPFVFSNSDTAIVEVTDSLLRFYVGDTLITRGSVSTAITNGTFSSNITSWTDASDVGSTAAWVTGGYAGLTGTKFGAARLRQQVTVAAGDQNDEHALRVVVARGNIKFKVGSSAGTDNYISETTLGVGTHSLTFTPTGDFYVDIAHFGKYAAYVDSVAVESSGTLTLPAPWPAASLGLIRYEQSGDIIYLSCDGYQQRKIERRSTKSWSIVLYEPEDGPFRNINTGGTTITASATYGDVTLSSNLQYFKSTMVGSLIRVDSGGQYVSQACTGENQWTNSIRVTGVGASRDITVARTGTFVANILLQKSFDEGGSWVTAATYTTAASVVFNDALDNQIVYYRIGIATGGYTSGTATVSLDFAAGSITGIARITAYTGTTNVSASILKDFGSTTASGNFYEAAWSDRRGYPTAVVLYEGRLCWAGRDKLWMSVSDGFESFDLDVEGDSGPISRSIGKGPVDKINWILDLNRLILGAEGAEWTVKSTSFDEPITPTNLNIKSVSTQGSTSVAAIKIDSRGIFAQKSGTKVFQLVYDPDVYDYISDELTKLVPEIAESGIVRMAVQRQPDTRIHVVLENGTVAILVQDPAENVKCWVKVASTGASGLIEDVVILPGTTEDAVYYTVKRTINSATVRYLEKWALESECQGGSLNKQADSFLSISQASSTTITGLTHLEGATVCVWANTKNLGTYTVASGAITVSEAVTTAIVGLVYTAAFKSSKLAYAAEGGTALLQRKRVGQVGVLLYNTHYQGLKYGPDADNLDDLPLTEEETDVTADTVHATYDNDMFSFPGVWGTDERIYLQATAPKPCTLLGLVFSIETNG